MCGFTGFLWAPGSAAGQNANARVEAMMAQIAHRGPDSQGAWTDETSGVALGHLRLAIVDLSAAGHQPMMSASERFALSYNGEIYNHTKVRAELEQAGLAPPWKGSSDTETLLAAIEAWGFEPALSRLQGMFAIALWDTHEHTLTMARDRMGEKPLYYGWQGEGASRAFLFGSELKALRAHPSFEARINRQSVLQFIRHGHVPEDMAIFEGISKLRPGEMAVLSLKDPEPARKLYWDGGAIAAAPRSTPPSPEAAVDALDDLLKDAVGQQMMSDVPLGAFLSGGIDSSAVVGIMQHLSDRPVHTFSIGFEEKNYNEAEFAAEVAKHLGTEHTYYYVKDTELRDVVPRLPVMFDEPFADSSQIPTYLVAELARRHVTVALSGDGGDELFCGYNRYRQGADLMSKLGSIPTPLRSMLGGAARSIPVPVLNKLLGVLKPTAQGTDSNGQRIHRLANYASSANADELHRKMVSIWRFPEQAVPGVAPPASILADHLPPRGDLCDAERMMQLDMLAYMPDDILTKVDRSTMAVALESRAPLLDHRVAEFAWSLPYDYKVRDNKSKWLLRQVLYRYVPAHLIERPKMGFEVPIGLWLRGGLRDWADALLDPQRIAREGYLDPDVISRIWKEHQSGAFNWGQQLWNVLMFQAWLEESSAAIVHKAPLAA